MPAAGNLEATGFVEWLAFIIERNQLMQAQPEGDRLSFSPALRLTRWKPSKWRRGTDSETSTSVEPHQHLDGAALWV